MSGLRRRRHGRRGAHRALVKLLAAGAVSAGGVGALGWTALKIGALSFGGGS